MPISRAAFRIQCPGRTGIGARPAAQAIGELENFGPQFEGAIQRLSGLIENGVGRGRAADAANPRAGEDSLESRGPSLTNLPAADATSAGNREDIGANQPQTDTRRSVATGRDAPHFLEVAFAGENSETNGGTAAVQTQMIERRFRAQRDGMTEQLAGLHGFLERLLELTEGHVFDGGDRLQSLEQKLARLEMRSGLNRNSP